MQKKPGCAFGSKAVPGQLPSPGVAALGAIHSKAGAGSTRSGKLIVTRSPKMPVVWLVTVPPTSVSKVSLPRLTKLQRPVDVLPDGSLVSAGPGSPGGPSGPSSPLQTNFLL